MKPVGDCDEPGGSDNFFCITLTALPRAAALPLRGVVRISAHAVCVSRVSWCAIRRAAGMGEERTMEFDLSVDEQVFAVPGEGYAAKAAAVEPRGTYTITTTCWGPCVQQ